MKYLYKILFVLFTLTQTVSAQTYSSIISDDEIYSFISWLKLNSEFGLVNKPSNQKQIISAIIPWSNSDLLKPRTRQDSIKYIWKKSHTVEIYDTVYFFQDTCMLVFNTHDKRYIQKQFKKIKNNKWSNKVTKDSIYEVGNSNPSFQYSIPLFSLNKKFVLVYESYRCGGLCGSYGINIYKRKDYDSWTYYCNVKSGVF